MRWMGLDVGDKRIGIAFSDPMGIIAQGHSVLQRTDSLQRDLGHLAQLIVDFEVQNVLIGLPKNMNGTEGPMAEKIRYFGNKLADMTDIPVRYWDERLSTGSAQKVLIEADLSRKKRKQKIDQVAAVIILQNFLDSTERMNFTDNGKPI